MALWCYRCKACKADGLFGFAPNRQDFEGKPGRANCPTCGRPCNKLAKPVVQEGPRVHLRGDIKPYYSEAMGVGPGEPGLPGEHYNGDGDLLVTSRRHKRALMRTLNYRETR